MTNQILSKKKFAVVQVEVNKLPPSSGLLLSFLGFTSSKASQASLQNTLGIRLALERLRFKSSLGRGSS